jgi:uncharacterized protein
MTVQALPEVPIDLHQDALETLCRKWEIVELALFGSVLRDDFGPDSDLDILVTFKADAGWSLWDFVGLREELANLLARRVDLVSRGALRNPIRRREILASRRVVFADADA